MKIEHYISQLLYRYQCVTVPGFGAFLTEFQSAKLDKNSYSFHPPKKSISFNPYLKNNDGLLANHLAQAEKITYEIAVNAIQNEVSHWKTKIQELGHFSIKNVGEFSLNSEKNLVFVPVDQINYLKESFGLSAFISPEVKRDVVAKELPRHEIEAPIIFIPEKRANFSIVKYAAVFAISIGLTGVLGYGLYGQYLKHVEQETLLVQSNVQKKINQKIQEATFFIANPLPAVTLSVPNEKRPYHVVAGAFRLESNAENAYNSLLKLGFTAKRLPANKHGLFPVLFGSYSSYLQAREAMATIQKLNNKDAWLLIQEL